MNNEKKLFQAPEIEVYKFDLKDVISASGEEPAPSGNSGGGGPILPCHGQDGNQPGC